MISLVGDWLAGENIKEFTLASGYLVGVVCFLRCVSKSVGTWQGVFLKSCGNLAGGLFEKLWELGRGSF